MVLSRDTGPGLFSLPIKKSVTRSPETPQQSHHMIREKLGPLSDVFVHFIKWFLVGFGFLRLSLSSSDYPGTSSVDQAGLELRDPPVFVS